MNDKDYKHLLEDHTPCVDIDTSGSASEHELAELTKLAGHASLTSYLNDHAAWNETVAQVAETLLSAMNTSIEIPPAQYIQSLAETADDCEIFGANDEIYEVLTIPEARAELESLLREHQTARQTMAKEAAENIAEINKEIAQLEAKEEQDEERDYSLEIFNKKAEISKIDWDESKYTDESNTWTDRNNKTRCLTNSEASIAMIKSAIQNLTGAEERYRAAYMQAIEEGYDAGSAEDYGNDAI